jgi:hypothetical protein
MITSGILRVNAGVSRLNGTRLARQGASDPFGAATNFLANRGLSHNDFISVDGTNGFVGNVPVIFITDAKLATPAIVGVMVAGAVSAGPVKAATKWGGAKKAGTKKTGARKAEAKKTRTKKSGAKKSAGGRATAKRSAKKTVGRKSQKGSRKRQ